VKREGVYFITLDGNKLVTATWAHADKALRRDARRVLSRLALLLAMEFAVISMYHGKAGITDNDIFVD